MIKHRNPYRIHDPNNLFEVFFNSSHPELKEKKRILNYKGRIFKDEGSALSFFDSEGIDWRRLKLVPRWENFVDEVVIVGYIAEHVPKDRRELHEILKESGRAS